MHAYGTGGSGVILAAAVCSSLELAARHRGDSSGGCRENELPFTEFVGYQTPERFRLLCKLTHQGLRLQIKSSANAPRISGVQRRFGELVFDGKSLPAQGQLSHRRGPSSVIQSRF